MLSSASNTISETRGGKPEGSRVARVIAATPELSGVSRSVSEMELRELDSMLLQLELHASCKTRQIEHALH
jgi:hypothetical protein